MSMNRRGIRNDASLRRGKPFREPKESVLIVCGGKKTEIDYFESFRSREIPLDIQSAGAAEPKAIYRFAKRLARDYDWVWCVFDWDQRGDLEEAVGHTNGGRQRIQFAYSNPCFEVWYLLHFQELTSFVKDAETVIGKLEQYIPGYNRSNDYSRLLAKRQELAFQNAQLLWRENIEKWRNRYKNPSTSVDQLVAFLRSLRGEKPIASYAEPFPRALD